MIYRGSNKHFNTTKLEGKRFGIYYFQIDYRYFILNFKLCLQWLINWKTLVNTRNLKKWRFPPPPTNLDQWTYKWQHRSSRCGPVPSILCALGSGGLGGPPELPYTAHFPVDDPLSSLCTLYPSASPDPREFTRFCPRRHSAIRAAPDQRSQITGYHRTPVLVHQKFKRLCG